LRDDALRRCRDVQNLNAFLSAMTANWRKRLAWQGV
jgi:hypothetical protein